MKSKFTKMKSFVWFGALAITTLLLFSSCNLDSDTNVTSENPASSGFASKFSASHGEDIFRQVFFFEGGKNNMFYSLPAYQNIMALADNLSAEQKWQREQSLELIIKGINQNDPVFFDKFEDAVSSKNPQIISNALLSGSNAIEAATQSQNIILKYQDANNGWVIYPPIQTQPVIFPFPVVIMLVLPAPPVFPGMVTGYVIGQNPKGHQLVSDQVVAILAN